MKRDLFTKIGFLIVIVLLMGNLMVMLQAPSHAAGTVQYNVVPLNTGAATQQQLQSVLDQQGNQGWELITRYGTSQGDVLIFKK